MINTHLWVTINGTVTGPTNVGAESISSRIRVVKVRLRGFRNK